MRLYGRVTYVCHTCGEKILNPDGTPTGVPGVLFVDSEDGKVMDEPPFTRTTTSHHKSHLTVGEKEQPDG